jgi:hypothetical protein
MKPKVKSMVNAQKKTFRRMRKIIGYLGIGLPLVLFVLSLIPFFKTPLQNSISYYYYTNLRDIFIGVMCAVSFFLVCYKSSSNEVFWKDDNKMTNLAGFLALGVALAPTNPESCSEKIYALIPLCAKVIGCLHYIFAILFFAVLAEISIVVFTIGQKKNRRIRQSLFNENNIYRICGWIIVACVLLIIVCKICDRFPYLIFWLEFIALASFGISWLIKGRFLGDTGNTGRILYMEDNKKSR